MSRRSIVSSGIVLLLAGLGFACAASERTRPLHTQPVNEGAGTVQAARKYLEGQWSLMSFEVTPPGRDPITVKAKGKLVFDAFSNLAIELQTDAETAARLAAVGIPMQENGWIRQEGRVAVDMQNHTLTYVMDGAPALGVPSGPLASNRPRYWQVDGKILTLSTKDDQGAPLSVGRWLKQ